MSDIDAIIAQNIVRRFSDQLAEQSQGSDRTSSRKTLERALTDEMDQQRAIASEATALLQEFGSLSLKATRALQEQYQSLKAAMEAFNNILPEKDKEALSSKRPSWESLHTLVQNLKKQHDTNRSKGGFLKSTKKSFHKLCEALDAHSNALKLLPAGSEYTSIVCGSLETITKASVNYVQIDEEFTCALEEINLIVVSIERELKLHREPFLEGSIVQLCCKIVTFLTAVVTWYTQKSRKRLALSFNQKLVPNYQHFIASIRMIAEDIRNGARFCTSKEIRGLSNSVHSVERSQDEILEHVIYLREVREHDQKERWRRDQEQLADFRKMEDLMMARMSEAGSQFLTNMAQEFGCSIGKPMKNILDSDALHFVNNARLYQSQAVPSSGLVGPLLQPGTHLSAPSDRYETVLSTRIEVEEASERLTEFFEYDRIFVPPTEAQTYAEVEVIQRLQLWITLDKSGFLAIVGPSTSSSDAPTLLITSHYVQAARFAGLTCISYFCRLSHEEPSKDRLRETIGLVALLYGLIKQLILCLPERLPAATAARISRARFEELDGTMRTWKAALALLQDLLECVQGPIILCAIYGIEILEHPATETAMTDFISAFRRVSQDSDTLKKNILKVLFLTSGLSRTIAGSLKPEEMIDICRGSAADSPGLARKGRAVFRDVL